MLRREERLALTEIEEFVQHVRESLTVLGEQPALQTELSGQIARLLLPLHPADIAEIITELTPALRVRLLGSVRINVEAYTYLDDVLRDELIELHGVVALSGILTQLESDDLIDLIEDIEDTRRSELIQHLPIEAQEFVRAGLSFDEDTAGRLMRREMVAVPQHWLVGEIIDHLRLHRQELPERFASIYLVDPFHRPVATIETSQLLCHRRNTPAVEIGKDPYPFAPDQHEKEVARAFRKYNLVEAPVVNETGKLIGSLTLDDMVQVTHEAVSDDLLNISGVGSDDFYADFLGTAKLRFSWLFVNLLTALLASLVIGFFQHAIEQVVALAVLMPIAASMGGNAGTQSLAISIRALATTHLTRFQRSRIVLKETLVACLNGCAFAAITAFVAYLWFDSPWIAVIVGIALLLNMVLAGCLGSFLPLMLERMKIDPAAASPIILTTATDIVGFSIFLGSATFMLAY